jgi:hypothetical protein
MVKATQDPPQWMHRERTLMTQSRNAAAFKCSLNNLTESFKRTRLTSTDLINIPQPLRVQALKKLAESDAHIN